MISSGRFPVYIFFTEVYYSRLGGVLEWDKIFFAVVMNRVARQVDFAVLVKLIALCCETFYFQENCSPNVKGCGVHKPRNESVFIITHDCDLKKLFPGNIFIEDN